MNPLTVLRDSLYFFRRHLVSIAGLCLPLVLLEAVCSQLLYDQLGDDASPAYGLLVGLLFYPLYSAALILYLDARTDGHEPLKRNLLARALQLWPTFALLVMLSSLLIMAGISLFILPGIWVMTNLVFAEYLLVLQGRAPIQAMRESFQMVNGNFWRILVCLLGVMAPLWLFNGITLGLLPEQVNPVLELLVNVVNSFLQLFSTVVLFRLYMLLSEANPARS
ncbi:hypothetical protein V0R50_02950 [Pseudomonas sp. 148P]|uniref:DUF7847 domain-containing protein n=1 Tax=Pseudomonas ulcerans TaxID=3115852 RepID=A0ABU7HKV5_9PSED|nr:MULTISPECIES: hypothetical protein [unclassified Pseudomonas]MEE1920932.1 hypothetical protein [Pseudomonas sp. 147P]MEE1932167.1 hypothetical protein [Pseudomonas sp. 148P]